MPHIKTIVGHLKCKSSVLMLGGSSLRTPFRFSTRQMKFCWRSRSWHLKVWKYAAQGWRRVRSSSNELKSARWSPVWLCDQTSSVSRVLRRGTRYDGRVPSPSISHKSACKETSLGIAATTSARFSSIRIYPSSNGERVQTLQHASSS